MNIPIINRSGDVVGWTDSPPSLVSGRLEHRKAAALLKAELKATYVEISGEDALRAGAPPNWEQPWRCLAICPADFDNPELVTWFSDSSLGELAR
ncbi:MAG: hypothetical protein ACREIP_16065 [Alphaproteobacteria bacterium]